MGSQFVIWSQPWPVVNSTASWLRYLSMIPASGQLIQ
jgi:hypothetical protein